MSITISGVWTTMLISMVMIVGLYGTAKASRTYQRIPPGVVILCCILIALRLALPIEFVFVKGFFFNGIVPIDRLVRYELFSVMGVPVTLWTVLTAVWLTVGLAKVGKMTGHYFQMKAMLSTLGPLDARGLRLAAEAEHEAAISGGVVYKMSDEFNSPFVFGAWRPVVVVPELLADFTDKEYKMILCHELNHWKRRDCFLKITLELLACIFWWFPFFAPLMKELDQAVEVRADWNTVKNMDSAWQGEYLETLYHLSEAVTGRNKILCANMFTNGQVTSLEKRFRFLAGKRRWRWTGAFYAGAVGIFLASYLFVIEPRYEPNDGSIKCEETCTVYVLENGNYLVFMDGEEFGIENDIGFLSDSSFDGIEITIIGESVE